MMSALVFVVATSVQTASAGPEAAVHQLLDGWRTGDFERASAAMAQEFRLLTLRRGDGGPHLEIDTRAHLLESMRHLQAGAWDVRLGAVHVQSDGSGIATVWAPYTFYISGRKSHCGIETYTLYRVAGGWRIAEFADTHLMDGVDARCIDRPARAPTR